MPGLCGIREMELRIWYKFQYFSMEFHSEEIFLVILNRKETTTKTLGVFCGPSLITITYKIL